LHTNNTHATTFSHTHTHAHSHLHTHFSYTDTHRHTYTHHHLPEHPAWLALYMPPLRSLPLALQCPVHALRLAHVSPALLGPAPNVYALFAVCQPAFQGQLHDPAAPERRGQMCGVCVCEYMFLFTDVPPFCGLLACVACAHVFAWELWMCAWTTRMGQD